MKFVIRPTAKRDILRQFLFLLENDAPETAERFIEAVDRAVSQLTRQPRIGAPKKTKNPRLAGLRRWPVNGFDDIGIYYLLTKDVLRIVRILHGKRDVDRIIDK